MRKGIDIIRALNRKTEATLCIWGMKGFIIAN